KARLRAKVALLAGLRLRLQNIRAFRIYHARQATKATSLPDAYRIILAHRSAEAEKRRQKAEEAHRLKEYVGAAGVDADGRQLDHREFKVPHKALPSLATALTGSHPILDPPYRTALLAAVKPTFRTYGLPPDPGIQMEVADDGEAWYVWR